MNTRQQQIVRYLLCQSVISEKDKDEKLLYLLYFYVLSTVPN